MKAKRKAAAKQLLYHITAWVFILLFWITYDYSSNRKFDISLAVATADTMHYALGYYIISLILIPKYLHNKKVFAFITGFVIVLGIIGGSRLTSYRLISSAFSTPFPSGLASVLYLYTITFLILTAECSIKLGIDWLRSQKKIEEIEKEKARAELVFLKGQLNPHFLFNSINTLYGNIDIGNEVARNILIRLSDMLRYQLYECETDWIGIEKEITYIKNYIALQELRHNANLAVQFLTGDEVKDIKVPPLILSPLVENAFKHLSNFSVTRNEVYISLIKKESCLVFSAQNTYEDTEEQNNGHNGIGIANVKRRLALIYPHAFDLAIKKDAVHFTVVLKIELQHTGVA
jgi:hypothetical protein